MIILGQVKLSKGYLCPAGLEPPMGLEIGKTPPQIIFKLPRSSNKLESALIRSLIDEYPKN